MESKGQQVQHIVELQHLEFQHSLFNLQTQMLTWFCCISLFEKCMFFCPFMPSQQTLFYSGPKSKVLLVEVDPFEIRPSSALSFLVSHLCIFPFIKQERRWDALPRELLPRVFFSLSLFWWWLCRCIAVHSVNCLLFVPAISLTGDALKHLNRVTFFFLTDLIILSIC